MFSTDYTILTGKLFASLGGMASSTFLIVADTMQGVPFLQYGAIGILGACTIYVVTRLVPQAIQSRREETAAFISTLTSEREKLVASMDRLTSTHSSDQTAARKESDDLLRELNDATIKERKTWAALMADSNVLHTKSYGILKEVSVTLREIKQNTDIEVGKTTNAK